MRVLGIDPGYGRCGVAVVERVMGKDTLLHSSCIETKASDQFSQRLILVGNEIVALIEQYAPDAVVIEEVYFSKNQKTAFNVAEVRGMLIFIAASKGRQIFEYNPMRVKVAITGHGKASKQQVTTMIERIVKPNKKILHDDEYDAIAVALTHLAEWRNPIYLSN